MKIVKLLTVFFIAAAPLLQAQSLRELSAGQTSLAGNSAYQKHSDLEKYDTAARQKTVNSVPIAEQAEASNALSVARLPDIKLNENIITKTVMDYSLSDDLKAGAFLHSSENKTTAITKYEEIIVTADSDIISAKAAGEIAIIYFQNGEFKKAHHYADQALSLDKENPFYQLIKVWLYAAQLNTSKAKKEYEKLLFLTADFEYVSSARLALAAAYCQTKKYKEAMPIFQDLYARNPYVISYAIYNMGRVSYHNEDYGTAYALFEQALSHDNNNYMAQKYIAMTQEKMKMNTAAWQSYASIFILDTKDKFIAKKLDKLGKELKLDPLEYLFHTRLSEIFLKTPDIQKSIPARIGLFAKYDGTLTNIQSFALLPGAAFSIKDDQLGKVISGAAYTPKNVIFDAENKGVHIQNKWNTSEFSTKRPFLIDLDKAGYTVLIRDIKTKDIFASNVGDKELKGSILIIPGETGMTMINYTTLEDALPAILMTITRGIKAPAALEAVAIALRTKLMGEIKNSAGSAFDIPDNAPHFQYGGINMQSDFVKNAVEKTKNQTLYTDDINPVNVNPDIYRSCSVVSEDGIRNTREDINYEYSPSNLVKYMFSNPPKDLISAPQDPTLWSSLKWIYSIPLKDMEERLKQNHDIGKLKRVEPGKLSPSGRTLTVIFTGSKKSVELDFKEANFVLAAGTLRSDFFIMMSLGANSAKEVLFIGTDTGIGRGLCVDGAAGMAREEGRTSRQILKYYYPEYKITNRWIEPKSLL
jgi:SpoIID/LytB domain protein